MLIRRSRRSATAPASGPNSRYGSNEVIQTPPTATLPVVALPESTPWWGCPIPVGEQAQPVPQAGQRRGDPDPPERLDRQHAVVALAQRGFKAHCARLSRLRVLAMLAARSGFLGGGA